MRKPLSEVFSSLAVAYTSTAGEVLSSRCSKVLHFQTVTKEGEVCEEKESDI